MFHAPRPRYHHRRRTLCRNQPPRRPTLTSSFPHRSKTSAQAKAHFVSGTEESEAFQFQIPKSCPKTGATWKDADLLKLGVPKGKKKGKRPANVKRKWKFASEAAAIEFAKKMLKWLRDPKRVKSKIPTL